MYSLELQAHQARAVQKQKLELEHMTVEARKGQI